MNWQDGPPHGVYPALYEHILESREFQDWQTKHCHWQLRVFGGPGSGKTTLLRLAAGKLQAKYHGDKDRVAFVLLQPPAPNRVTGDSSILSEVFQSIRAQLDPTSTVSRHDECPEHVDTWMSRFQEGLVKRVQQLDNAFLLVDGIDWLREERTQDLLEGQLAKMQAAGLKVLASTRGLCVLPSNEAYWGNEYECDGKPDNSCGDTSPGMFWICAFDHEYFVLCASCRAEGLYCVHCGPGNDHFVQPHERVFIDLNRQVNFKMKDFLAWNMEGEHGDLGLASSHHDKPPRSALGAQRHGPRRHELRELLDQVQFQADGNIAMARMRMDLVHERGAVQARTSEMLPDVVVRMFDAVVDGMMRGLAPGTAPAPLGISALVAFTFLSRRSDFEAPVEVGLLARASALDASAETCAIQTLFKAARGLLVAERLPETGLLTVVYYNRAFQAYMAGEYNHLLRDRERDMARDPRMLASLRARPETENVRFVEWLSDVEEGLPEVVDVLGLEETSPDVETSTGVDR